MLRPGALRSILRTSTRTGARPPPANEGALNQSGAAPGLSRAASSAPPRRVPVLESTMQVEAYLEMVQRRPVSGFAFTPRPRPQPAVAAVPAPSAAADPAPANLPPASQAADGAGPVDELHLAFDQIDADGSGQLDREEIRLLIQQQGGYERFSDGELDAAMEELDPSGDGLVSFAEFKGYWLKSQQSAGEGEIPLSPWQEALASGVFSSIGERQEVIRQRRSAWYISRGIEPWYDRRMRSLEEQEAQSLLAAGSNDSIGERTSSPPLPV